eukprot:SAG31_NODE_765_length_12248_cov_6.802947_20_plen_279_part_00
MELHTCPNSSLSSFPFLSLSISSNASLTARRVARRVASLISFHHFANASKLTCDRNKGTVPMSRRASRSTKTTVHPSKIGAQMQRCRPMRDTLTDLPSIEWIHGLVGSLESSLFQLGRTGLARKACLLEQSLQLFQVEPAAAVGIQCAEPLPGLVVWGFLCQLRALATANGAFCRGPRAVVVGSVPHRVLLLLLLLLLLHLRRPEFNTGASEVSEITGNLVSQISVRNSAPLLACRWSIATSVVDLAAADQPNGAAVSSKASHHRIRSRRCRAGHQSL